MPAEDVVFMQRSELLSFEELERVVRVATTLGINLSTRKMAQIAPVIGAAVGAGVNAAFQKDVADAAQFAFRARWLEVNECILEGSLSKDGAAN